MGPWDTRRFKQLPQKGLRLEMADSPEIPDSPESPISREFFSRSLDYREIEAIKEVGEITVDSETQSILIELANFINSLYIDITEGQDEIDFAIKKIKDNLYRMTFKGKKDYYWEGENGKLLLYVIRKSADVDLRKFH